MVTRDDTATLRPRNERPVAALLGDLARESTRLIRQEIALAKAEFTHKLSQMGVGAGELVAGGFVIYAGFLALLAAAILGLSELMRPWLAALIVAIVVMIIGAVLALKGRRDIKAEKLVPDRTLRTLREDAEWAREQMR